MKLFHIDTTLVTDAAIQDVFGFGENEAYDNVCQKKILVSA